MSLNTIKENNKKWVQNKLNINPDTFKNLAKGQSPKIFYIGCCDSRVCPELFMGLGPGDVFVHRNIANSVFKDDLSCISALTYAVDFLNVEHVVVCGHYECGGINAVLNKADCGDINPWLEKISTCCSDFHSDGDQFKDLVEHNVNKQAENLLGLPVVKNAIENKGLKIHKWVFDIESGLIKDLD